MSIKLKPEQEQIIRDEIRCGRFRTAEEVLDHALAALREESSTSRSNGEKLPKNLATFLMESSLPGSGLDLGRSKDGGRDIEL